MSKLSGGHPQYAQSEMNNDIEHSHMMGGHSGFQQHNNIPFEQSAHNQSMGFSQHNHTGIIEESKLDGGHNVSSSDFLSGLGIMKNHSNTMIASSGRPQSV